MVDPIGKAIEIYKNLAGKNCKQAAKALSIALHMIQDSFSQSYVVRNPEDWTIIQFQNYTDQSSSAHSKADKALNSPEYNQAVAKSSDFLSRVICKGESVENFKIWLKNEIFNLSENATIGGSAPQFKK